MLVSSLDGISLLRRSLQDLLLLEDAKRKLPTEKGMAAGSGLMDLPSHAILDRGRLVGLWEFDTANQSIAWLSLIPKDKALEAAVAKTEQYVRTQLGDARSFSLDSPASREPKIKALRAAG